MQIKLIKNLKWKPQYSVEEAVKSAWEFEKNAESMKGKWKAKANLESLQISKLSIF
jgi:hypothetical protein